MILQTSYSVLNIKIVIDLFHTKNMHGGEYLSPVYYKIQFSKILSVIFHRSNDDRSIS